MGVPFRPEPMTANEFFAFTATRPDDEKWELIDGEPIMNASASYLHQVIVKNIIVALSLKRRAIQTPWVVIPGMGVRVSDTRVPVPDVIVRPNDIIASSECDDMLVAFEVLSPSTADRDLRWKRKTYSVLPALQYYVIVAQDRVEVLSFNRSANFTEERLEAIACCLDLPAIGVSIPLADIYTDTGF